MKAYEVGGAVRDRLLGLPVSDRDYVVVGATPEQMERLGYRPVGKDFPVFLHPQTHEEYALARTERKTARGYKGFEISASPEVTLEQDLARRDLTINAIACDGNGELIDPYHGIADLKAGVLRHVSPAFVEDPVRVLRVARFAARFGFAIAPETLTLMREMARNGEIDHLVAERVWQELARGLMEEKPSRMLLALRECDALAHVLPEVDALFGIPQPAQHHPEVDTGRHILLVIDYAATCSYPLTVRFAAMVHDLGKAATPPAQWPRHHGHEQRSVGLVEGLCDRLRVPGDCRDLAILSARHHLDVHRAQELRPATVLKLLAAADIYRRPDRFEELLAVCLCDFRGREGFENRPYPQADLLREAAAAARDVDAGGIARVAGDPSRIASAIDAARLEAVADALTRFRQRQPGGTV
ncbi:MAG TPA: multifunctional CCA addition/repair protein [Burkholderiales bacterium]|nr:multifunctional CCA addition/repair protein [Burkholderiales bacterium]